MSNLLCRFKLHNTANTYQMRPVDGVDRFTKCCKRCGKYWYDCMDLNLNMSCVWVEYNPLTESEVPWKAFLDVLNDDWQTQANDPHGCGDVECWPGCRNYPGKKEGKS